MLTFELYLLFRDGNTHRKEKHKYIYMIKKKEREYDIISREKNVNNEPVEGDDCNNT